MLRARRYMRMVVLGIAAAGALSVPAAPVSAAPHKPVITTVAGTGDARTGGDGGPARTASIAAPTSLATAPDGTVYVLTELRVRAIDTHGTIRTVAGTGKAGFSGDGGPADEATLNPGDPGNGGGMTVGPDGTLYIADTLNNRIRAVDPETHTISTVAGSGPVGREAGDDGGNGGPATKARLDGPQDVAVGQDGTLYIADSGNGIRSIDARRHVIRSVLDRYHLPDGAGTSMDMYPVAIEVGPDGTIYYTSSGDLWSFDPKHRALSAIAKQEVDYDGSLRQLALIGSTLYAVSSGYSYSDGAVVYATRLDEDPTLTVFAGNPDSNEYDSDSYGDGGAPTTTRLSGVGVDVTKGPGGTVYISDPAVHRIRSVGKPSAGATERAAGPRIQTLVGGGDDGADDTDEHGRFDVDVLPLSVAVAGDGTVYLADGNQIRAIDPGSGTVHTVAGTAEDAAELGRQRLTGTATDAPIDDVRGLSVGPDHVLYFVTGRPDNAQVAAVDLAGGTISTVLDGARFSQARDTAVDSHGVLYVSYLEEGAHGDAGRVCAVRPHSTACTTILDGAADPQDPVRFPSALAIDPKGMLYAADAHWILSHDTNTGRTAVVAGIPTPRDLGVDDTEIHAEHGDALSAEFGDPMGLATGPDGMLYVADAKTNRVRAIDPKAGTYATLAGSRRGPGTDAIDDAGFSGDGGPADRAQLNAPSDVAVGPHGAVYVADTNNHRIRVVGDVTVPPNSEPISYRQIIGWGVLVLLLMAIGAVTLVLVHRRRRSSPHR